ncbi:hypothetical protein FHS70_000920 [Flammeovirga yaeyamensis]|nr:hypothetical protein [Flammeovirga yaeyamensis]
MFVSKNPLNEPLITLFEEVITSNSRTVLIPSCDTFKVPLLTYMISCSSISSILTSKPAAAPNIENGFLAVIIHRLHLQVLIVLNLQD